MPDQPKDPIDPKSFLLPKKETGPSPLSAQRINAGALLAQEDAAAVEMPKEVPKAPQVSVGDQAVVTPQQSPAPAQMPEKKSSDFLSEPQPGSAGQTFPPAPGPTPAASPTPKKEETMVHAVETYTTDINRVVQSGGVSTVSIAAAEADRRSKATKDEAIAPANIAPRDLGSRWRIVLIIGGVLLIFSAIGIVAVLLSRAAPQATTTTAVQAPFMNVDHVTPVVTTAADTRDMVITNLEAAREQVSLAVGLVDQLYVGTASSTNTMLDELSPQQLLSILAPDIPQDLLRTIKPQYLLGVHSYDENQSFLVLQVDSYQQAYAGMLAWEPTMQQELSPLFTRTPSLHVPGDSASSTATSSPVFLQTGFVDKVVENHDARAIVNPAGDLLLLWTFLDRNTLVITTNEYTLREIIRRLNTSSLVPQP